MSHLVAVQIVREVLEDFNTRDPDRAVRLYAEDAEHHVPALRACWRGRSALVQAYRGLVLASPDIQIHPLSIWGDAERAVAEWTMDGTSERPYGDLPATGRAYLVQGVSIVSVADGQVRHRIDYWDLATILRQVGLIPPFGSPRSSAFLQW